MSKATTHLEPRSSASRQTILVVEDEILVRLVIADYLRECGYKVHEAVNAREALAMLQAPHMTIDVVFSDVQMPGEMDGFGLARWIRANRPGVQVILTSGVERSAEIAASLCEVGPLLMKPYPPQDVVARIRQLSPKPRRP